MNAFVRLPYVLLYCFVDFSYQNLSDSVWHFWFYMWNVPTWKLYFILPGRRFYRLMTPSKSWNRSSSTRMRYSKSQDICTRFCCALLCCGYAIVHNEFTWSIYHIHQGCFAGTGAIVRLPQCQWSKPDVILFCRLFIPKFKRFSMTFLILYVECANLKTVFYITREEILSFDDAVEILKSELKHPDEIQYIPRNMHTVLLCLALLWLCNRS